ncbi:MAG: O-antigen ligase family protein [Planctomycetota bacterium]
MFLKATYTIGERKRFAHKREALEPITSNSLIQGRRDLHPGFLLLGMTGGVAANLATVLLIGQSSEFVVKSGVVIMMIAAAFFIKPSFVPLKAFAILIPLGAFVLLALVSWAYNRNPAFGLLRWCLVAAYFWAVARISWQSPGKRDRTISMILGLTLAGGIFTVYVYSSSTIQTSFGLRSSVEFLHPNTQAFICAGTASMAAALFTLCRSVLFKCILSGIGLLSLWGLIITASRMPVVALLAGIAVLLTIRYGYPSPGRKPVLIVSQVLAFTVVYLTITSLFKDQFYEYMRYDNLEDGSGRLDTYLFVLNEMFNPPIMPLGLGPGAGAPYLLDQMNLSSAHNALLQAIVDLGPLGFLPFVWMLAVAGGKAFKAQNRFPLEIAFFSSMLVFAMVRSMGEQELLGLGNSFDLTLPFVLSKLWQSSCWHEPDRMQNPNRDLPESDPSAGNGFSWRTRRKQEIT